MKVLILVSAAENFPPFFVKLGHHLEDAGHQVTFAFESHLADYTYPESRPRPTQQVRYFSDYFSRADGTLPAGYEQEHLWRMLYPDFERFETFGVHSGKPRAYFAKLLAALVGFFDELFSRDGNEVVFFENVSNAFAFAAYAAAARHGRKYLGIASSRLPGRFEIQDTIFEVGEPIRTTFEQLRASPAAWQLTPVLKDYLERLDKVEPDYMKNNVLAPDRSFRRQYVTGGKLRYLGRLMRYVCEQRKDIPYAHQMGNPLYFSLRQVSRTLGRKARLPYLHRYFTEPAPDDRYYLYPIHFHPESSTSVLSPEYIDEYDTIRSIAFNLPFGTTLYVKDHKSAAGYPSLQFYRKVRRLPNVKLIHYNADTKKLIRKSLGIITLTSTVGYEALLLGKPVYLLGRVFYEFHPNCHRVGRPSDLFPLLTQGGALPPDTEREQAFLAAYFRHTYEGTLSFIPQGGTTAVYDAIARHLETMAHSRK